VPLDQQNTDGFYDHQLVQGEKMWQTKFLTEQQLDEI
jgi:hypothetical protein